MEFTRNMEEGLRKTANVRFKAHLDECFKVIRQRHAYSRAGTNRPNVVAWPTSNSGSTGVETRLDPRPGELVVDFLRPSSKYTRYLVVYLHTKAKLISRWRRTQPTDLRNMDFFLYRVEDLHHSDAKPRRQLSTVPNTAPFNTAGHDFAAARSHVKRKPKHKRATTIWFINTLHCLKYLPDQCGPIERNTLQ